MNHVEGRPDFKHEVAPPHRVIQQVLTDSFSCVAHDTTTSPEPERTDPTTIATTPVRAREFDRGVDGIRVDRYDHTQPAVEDAHHLVGVHPTAALDLEEDLRASRNCPSR